MSLIHLLTGFLLICPTVYSGEIAVEQLMGTIESDFQPATLTTPEKSAAGEFISTTWSIWRSPEEMKEGAWEISYEGETIYLKLAFKRGNYDPVTKYYKARPGLVSLRRNSDNGKWYAGNVKYLDEDIFDSFPIKGNPGKYIIMRKEKDSINIYAGNSGTILYSKKISDLYNEWITHAAAFKASLAGRTFYFVPQAFYSDSFYGERAAMYFGVVIAERYLLDYLGQPQDFVKLGEYYGMASKYNSISYSLPMGLVFEKGGDSDSAPHWTVRLMRKSDLPAAQNDMLSTGRKK